MANVDENWWTSSSDNSIFLPTFSPSDTLPSPPPPTSSDSQSSPTPTDSPIQFPGSESYTQTSYDYSGSSLPSPSSSLAVTSVPIRYSIPITTSTLIPLTMTVQNTIVTTTTALETLILKPTTSWSYITSAPSAVSNARSICAGQGVDSMSIGAFSSLIFSAAVGAFIWLLFAILRPKIRQLYALREWFIRPELRPPRLGSSLFAFLSPPVPMVPSMPTDVSDLGDSAVHDARLFPSDDELSQRTIWTAFLLVLGWTIVGLAGALPIYMVSMPCAGSTAPISQYGGSYSALYDLSLIRLLRLLQDGNISTGSPNAFKPSDNSVGSVSRLHARLVVNGEDVSHKARVRLLILTVLLLAVAVLPALLKLFREFNRLLAYRRRWVNVRCEGLEMGWLSVDNAPGLRGQGENAVKELFTRYGFSSAFSSSNTSPRRRRMERESTPSDEEDNSLTRDPNIFSEEGGEIDVTGVFSIVDTKKLRKLVRARDIVLNHLEQAECLYIDSFRLSSANSITASIENETAPAEETHPEISRPLPLQGSPARRGRREPYHSGAPTSYMAPSSYYRLRGVRGVSGGTFDVGRYGSDRALSDDVGQRIVGSRFQEVNRQSVTFGRLPLGSHVRIDRTGELNLALGPNYGAPEPAEEQELLDHEDWNMVPDSVQIPEIIERSSFLSRLGLGFPPRASRIAYPQNFPNESFYSPAGSTHLLSVPEVPEVPPKEPHFPSLFSDAGPSSLPSALPAPQLRLQLQEPMVRPISGLHHEHLGSLYTDIREWRARLKALNIEVADEQQHLYEDIAQGSSVLGWLVVGRGVRFLPGVRMIEGRSKDDIRWSELQHEGGTIGSLSFWIIVGVVSLLLAGALVPAIGLFLADAPYFAHFVHVLKPLMDTKAIGPSIATSVAPALAAILFICIAVGVVHYSAHKSGSVSNSQTRLTAFKATFFILTVVSGVWLIGISAVLFSLQALDTRTEEARTVAEGTIYIAGLVLMIGLNVAFIAPGLLLLQPVRLWRLTRAQWKAITPRQTFRALYPRPYNPSFGMGASVLAVFFAATMSLIFPLIGPPLVVLLFLTLIAHRYLVGYVYGRTDRGQSGGLLQLWLIRRFATMLALQPLLIGLIFLANRLWVLGCVLLGAAGLLVFVVEAYAKIRLREPGVRSLSSFTRESLEDLTRVIGEKDGVQVEDKDESIPSGREGRNHRRTRTSLASVLDMISLTLAVNPAGSRNRGPLPLPIESIDDLVSTARAAATHPDAPPRLNPPDPADDIADLLYPPELLAPVPVIWLSNDAAGVAQSEALDLQRFHNLEVVIDSAPPPPNSQ